MKPLEAWGAMPDRVESGLQIDASVLKGHAVEVWAPELQRVLRPGGHAWIRTRSHDEMGRALSHYFDVESTSRGLKVTRRPTATVAAHFEEIAHEYGHQIPEHIQQHFLKRKLDLVRQHVPPASIGLDLGCGVGRYASTLSSEGFRVVGLDPTPGAIKQARMAAPRGAFLVGDALRLPFDDGTFDFAYTINVLHHLKRGEQERALEELARVLKPEGTLVVHEMNTRNPMFRWYLRHLYPKIRTIDRGDEEFIPPARWPLTSSFTVAATQYMTFTPDFVPRLGMKLLAPVESWLEKSRAASYSAHYAVVLRRA